MRGVRRQKYMVWKQYFWYGKNPGGVLPNVRGAEANAGDFY
jgi:hypothetical protein